MRNMIIAVLVTTSYLVLNPGLKAQEDLLVWPLSEGRIWTYHCQDSNGTEWEETREVIDSNILGGQTYYKVRFIDNCPYDYEESDHYGRSTDTALYIWEDGHEVMDYVVGPVGFGLIVDPNRVREIVSKGLITVPYGGPYEAYSYGKRRNNEIDPYLIESFVPGLGFIKIVDYSGIYPPVIKELISISPDNLCGDYYHPYPAGDENHDCIVNFKDLSVLAAHWLVCTKYECLDYGFSGMYVPDLPDFAGYIQIIQTGDDALIYLGVDGPYAGVVSGNVISVTLNDAHNVGTMTFTFLEDGLSFTADYDVNGDTGTFTATKV